MSWALAFGFSLPPDADTHYLNFPLVTWRHFFEGGGDC